MLRLFCLIIIVLLFNPISIHAADIKKKLTDSNYNLVLFENFSKKFKYKKFKKILENMNIFYLPNLIGKHLEIQWKL